MIFEHELESGKKLQLVTEPKSHLMKWQFSPGGELPMLLQGLYTQEKYAHQAFQRYQEQLKEKTKK